MRYLSVCSGIEAATVAWHHLGWQSAAFAEIEPFPSAVLAHHYPDVPNVGDMTKFKEWQIGAIDLLVGGTPCQAFSVAGLRGGLSDARGNLSLTFCEIADHFDPDWILWENVPGVLSSKDNAFGCFLAGLSGAGEPLVSERGWDNAGLVAGPKRTVAWRVLDAQFNGVAQRRRRVFVLAVRGAGNWASARALFPLGEGVFWDTAPSREAREGAAVCPTLRAGGNRTGGDRPPGTDVDTADSLQVVAFGGNNTEGPIKQATALNANRGCHNPGDFEAGTLLVQQPVTYDLFNVTAPVNRQNRQPGDPCHTLARSNAEHAALVRPVAFGVGEHPDLGHCLRSGASKADKHESTTYIAQPVAFPANLSGTQHASTENLAPAMGAKNPTAVAIGWDEELNASTEQSGTLLRGGDGGRHDGVMTSSMQVRRLTPRECERLQGFPDDHTLIPWRGKPAAECPDGPRYKALGNSMAVPVMRWIGERVQLVAEGRI